MSFTGIPVPWQDAGLVTAMSVSVIALAGIAAVLGLLLVTLAIAPSISARAAAAYRARGLLSFGVGLATTAVLLAGAGIAARVPGLNLVAASVLIVGMVLSLVATAEALGHRLCVVAGKEMSRVGQIALGWPVFALASLVPVVGWFVIFPYGMIAGLGATVVGFFTRDDL